MIFRMIRGTGQTGSGLRRAVGAATATGSAPQIPGKPAMRASQGSAAWWVGGCAPSWPSSCGLPGRRNAAAGRCHEARPV
eukprot:9858583-Heterocapsa_arctica.AAC.1